MKEKFLKNVANHQMAIKLNRDFYRHLVFRNPKCSFDWFEIVTWPGSLAITGDMGTYVFSRTEDMFRFFRGHKEPNLGYWAEKVQAGASGGRSSVKEFSFRKLKEVLIDNLRETDLDSLPGGSRAKIFRALREDLFDTLGDYDSSHEEAHRLVHEFEYEGEQVFPDSFELDFTEFTIHFQWCCWAILWGIERYDKTIGQLQQVLFKTEVAQ